MATILDLFPARISIGSATVGGQRVPVLASPEFLRALTTLFDRVGGASAPSITEVVRLATSWGALQDDGNEGEVGPMGPPGKDGPQGAAGQLIPGEDGEDGEQGFPGATGAMGLQGIPGLSIRGEDGEDGEPGFMLLPDYGDVTGSWTPVLTFVTPGDLSVTYSTQVGSYTKIGRIVHLTFQIVTSAFTHTTASGNLNITGIPFASSNTTSVTHQGALVWQGITKASYTDIAPRLVSNSSTIDLMASGSGQAASNVAAADMPTGGTVSLSASLTYRI
jgi:hypothetical protein